MTIDADAVDELTLVGPGAGGMATASAVVADIADIARGIRSAPFGLPVEHLAAAERTPMQRHEGGYYIRLPPATISAPPRPSPRAWPSAAYRLKAWSSAARPARPTPMSCRWC